MNRLQMYQKLMKFNSSTKLLLIKICNAYSAKEQNRSIETVSRKTERIKLQWDKDYFSENINLSLTNLKALLCRYYLK